MKRKTILKKREHKNLSVLIHDDMLDMKRKIVLKKNTHKNHASIDS